jgi:signal transduction histidine kinase/ActR/RegA family two-component response regulator
MRAFVRRLPIKQKLVFMIMSTTIPVLVLGSVGYISLDYYRTRDAVHRDLAAQAELVLKSSTAALQFLDPATAREILHTFASNEHVRTACLYDASEHIFAEYLPARIGTECPTRPTGDGYQFSADALVIITSLVDEKGRRTGSLYVLSDLDVLKTRLNAQLAIVAIVLVLTTAVALLIASRVHSIVSDPITDLARTATAVSSGGDYSLRASRTTDDELGVLVDAFNRMLERIQLRERELSTTNQELRTEVAERRRAEHERAELLIREREANRVKDEFLATLSHELRTPLNAILGWTRLLRSKAVQPADVDRALEKVERNAQAQTRLVEDLLEVSRITTGKLRLEVKSLDLAAVATTAIESIRPTAEARGVTIDRRFASVFLPTAGDPDRLQQVIWNLISNAVKFTPAGGMVVVALNRHDQVDELSVSDTGVGIDPAFLPNVFDTFRQADGTSTRTHGGLGLGLSIVKHIVELHGGEVRAESEGVNKGARFTVRLPVRSAERVREARPRTPQVTPGPLTGLLAGTSIVVVDDDRDTRELLESVLSAAGAKVHLADTADEGFRLCLEESPDALITDIAMPLRDGYSLMRQLQKALGKDMPRATIALTAFATARDRHLAAEAGFDRHVSKPFDGPALVMLIRDLLSVDDARIVDRP